MYETIELSSEFVLKDLRESIYGCVYARSCILVIWRVVSVSWQ